MFLVVDVVAGLLLFVSLGVGPLRVGSVVRGALMSREERIEDMVVVFWGLRKGEEKLCTSVCELVVLFVVFRRLGFGTFGVER